MCLCTYRTSQHVNRNRNEFFRPKSSDDVERHLADKRWTLDINNRREADFADFCKEWTLFWCFIMFYRYDYHMLGIINQKHNSWALQQPYAHEWPFIRVTNGHMADVCPLVMSLLSIQYNIVSKPWYPMLLQHRPSPSHISHTAPDAISNSYWCLHGVADPYTLELQMALSLPRFMGL